MCSKLLPIDPNFVPDEPAVCLNCGKPARYEEPDYGDEFCSEECLAEHEQDAAEAAYDRSMDRYYGGDTGRYEDTPKYRSELRDAGRGHLVKT